MTTTRKSAQARILERRQREMLEGSSSRRQELALLLAASVVVAVGLALVYSGKTAREVQNGPLLDLNHLTSQTQLLPLLTMFPSADDRDFVARHIYSATRHGNHLENVGAIGRIRLHESEPGLRKLPNFEKRMAQASERRMERDRERQANRGWPRRVWDRLRTPPIERELTIPLLTGAQLAQLKPFLAVRERNEFRNEFLIWIGLYFVAFYAVHAWWRVRQFAGDNVLFPLIHLLSGCGLILMVSLRDPPRDTLAFRDFSEGVAWGCVAMILFTLPNYERRFSRLSYLPLIASLLLALALGLFGSGPGTSDAKVNLFFFQPVEVIRILIVLFLAGYFAQNWDALRELRQEHGPLQRLSSRFNIPRLDYVLPVIVGVALSLALFFWLSDLGPALVIGCLFLALYSLARNRAALAAAGFAVIILGFWVGHVVGKPETVNQRIEMWQSPWNNHVHGGEQLAHSLWALSTGAFSGTGLGLGDPETIPAGHTDLIVSSLGEEWGFLGVLGVYALYSILIYRSLRIAMNAPGVYSLFLVVGLTLINALQILLISGGILGLIPLSGVVSPFLSYGRTSMVANFALVAIILSVSATLPKKEHVANFGKPVRWLGALLAASFCVVIARAGYIQIVKPDDTVVKGALVLQADGVRRYEYNPRLLAVARQLPKGDIFDRNGLPLATSDAGMLQAHRQEYEKLGISVDRTSRERRHYPLGAPLFYLLGDVRAPVMLGASNTAFQERASRVRLQGYDDEPELELERDPKTGDVVRRLRYDYRELIPLLRHRYQPDNPAVKEILNRNRDVKMSIDAALQLRASTILRDHLLRMGKQKGALVIMDPSNGDLLAAVSYPWPAPAQFAALTANPDAETDTDLLDRARYGLYPPGSSFKIVTAMAALRKDAGLSKATYQCIRLPDGRIGNFIKGSSRPIRDDVQDTQPHGSVDMAKGIIVSCNAYFAQLGTYRVGAQALFDVASQLGIRVAEPNTPKKLNQSMPQASYGQGQVVASPFQMARVAATIANGGNAPLGRWVIDETNPRTREPEQVLAPDLAREIGGFMRAVVTSGTGKSLSQSAVPIAGKTGTAELAHAPSHAWFIGFAPYGRTGGKQIAFAVLVENGQYGGTAAVPIAGDIVAAARQLGII
ncbi:MAG: FtsW/RodA/SpoVE family cell cycle protein [Acidobacteriota bacterium]|nr:FtsW/RodA/SpoVE family cell cycle protein [Acidobacteriota bacterium]